MIMFFAIILISGVSSAEKAPGKSGVRYTKGKAIDFESLLIQGQIKRAEISVVTGQSDNETNGLLQLREDFLDLMAQDLGEEIK